MLKLVLWNRRKEDLYMLILLLRVAKETLIKFSMSIKWIEFHRWVARVIRYARKIDSCWACIHWMFVPWVTLVNNLFLHFMNKSLAYFLTIIKRRKNWTQFRITSKMVSKRASLRSPAEHPDAITINVITHRPTRMVSMIFHTDFQYACKRMLFKNDDHFLKSKNDNLPSATPILELWPQWSLQSW